MSLTELVKYFVSELRQKIEISIKYKFSLPYVSLVFVSFQCVVGKA